MRIVGLFFSFKYIAHQIKRESTEKCATVIDDDEDNVVSFSDDGCTTVCSLFTVHDSMYLLQFYFFISIFAIMLFIIS